MASRSDDAEPSGERPPMLKSMDVVMTEEMTKILNSIMRLKGGMYFNRPVDWVALKLPNYLEVIRQPMDLGTVKSHLEADRQRPYAEKHYQFAEEFAHDVRLVWKNAFLFNAPSLVIYKTAKQMSDTFEEKLHAVYRSAEQLGPPCPLKVRCQLLLSDMRGHPFSEWFRRDSDWKKLGEAYLRSLTSGTPMDLDQVQKRLVDGEYDTPNQDGDGGGTVFSVDAFSRDVGYIWKNAIEFNRPAVKQNVPGSGVFVICPKILQEVFAKRLEILRSAPVPAARGKRREEREGWPSFERKRDLARKAARLSTRSANEAADQVRLKCSAAVRTSVSVNGMQQAVVDLDEVDEQTFAHLEGLVKPT